MAKTTKAQEIPEILDQFAARYPQLWAAYNALAGAATTAGPLDEETQRLIKLAIAVGAQRRGAVHSHTKRALQAGATAEELEHVGILAITTIGWSGAFAAICWMHDIFAARKTKNAKKKRK